jgi:hypothetical protein
MAAAASMGAWRSPTFFLLLSLGVTAAHQLPDGDDAPIHAVKDVRSFGAAGDGVKDDTAAIIAAIEAARHQHSSTGAAALYSPIVLFFPRGTYRVSDTLQLFPDNVTCCPPRGDVQELALIVMGEGVGLSTVRLQDDAPGYGDPERTKPVFRTFPGPRWNDGQHLGYFDLTVHTGDRNPGAVGIDHLANNVGGSRHVRIEAGEGGGAVGLDFWRNLGGITYLSHIDVVGFDVGFNVSGFLMTLPMEHCSVRDARIGVALSEKGMQLRGFATTNVTHPVVASGNLTSLIVLDSQLIGTATGSGGAAAIQSDGGQLWARNVSTPGFRTAIATDRHSVADATSEYLYAEPLGLFPGATNASAALPIEDAPVVPFDPPAAWAIVNLDAQADDTKAIQTAIDSGKSTVFLNGSEADGTITDTLVLRGAVRRFHGGWRRLIPPRHSGGAPTFKALRFEVADHPVVVEFLDLGGGIQHSSDGTLVLSFCTWGGKWTEASVDGYNNTQGGKVFMEGSQPKGATPSGHSVGPGIHITPPHRLWARALDMEGFRNSLQNDNGLLWVMGAKFGESEANPYLRLWGGGATELLGGVFNGGNPEGSTAIVVHESDVTMVGWVSRFSEHNVTVNETAEGVARTLECCGQWPDFQWRNWSDPGIGNGELESGFHLPFYRSAFSTPRPFVTPLPPPRPPPPEPPPPDMPAACKAQALKDCPGPYKNVDACEDCIRGHAGDLLAHTCPHGPKNTTVSYRGVIQRVCTEQPRPPKPHPPPGPPSPPGPGSVCPAGPLPAACKQVLGALCPGDAGQGEVCRICVKAKRTDPRVTAACPHKQMKGGAQLCYVVTAEWCGNATAAATAM